MVENSINQVDKSDNPANLAEAREIIEKFWSILKRKVYENGWEAKQHQLKLRIPNDGILSLKNVNRFSKCLYDFNK